MSRGLNKMPICNKFEANFVCCICFLSQDIMIRI